MSITAFLAGAHVVVGRDAFTTLERGVESALRGEAAHEGNVFESTDAPAQYVLGILNTVPID